MAKQKSVIRVKLPRHDTKHSAWREAILDNIMKSGVAYGATDKYDKPLYLEVSVVFYLRKGKGVNTRDVDNLVKHLLDAFQGRFGKTRAKTRLIENDNIVRRVIMEKRELPKNLTEDYGGKLEIRPYVKKRAR